MAGTLKACRRQRDNKIKRDVKQLVFVQVAIRPHFSIAPYLPVGGLFWHDQKQNPAKRLWWWLGKSQVCVLFLAQNSAGNSTSLRARPCISDQTVNFLLQVQFDFLLLFSLICYDPATCEVLGDRKKKKKIWSWAWEHWASGSALVPVWGSPDTGLDPVLAGGLACVQLLECLQQIRSLT